MNFNLISGSKLANAGYRVIIEKGENDLKVYRGGTIKCDGELVATGRFENDLLKLDQDFKPISEKAFLSMEDHLKFGHLGTPNQACNTMRDAKMLRWFSQIYEITISLNTTI